jgi:CheY-like chemotaxis protein
MKPKIFYVDDDFVLLGFYANALKDDFDITVTSDPVDGIKTLKNNIADPFQVIVSDFDMPCMDGVEFLKQAKEIMPDSVRIMLTASSDIHVAINALAQGDIFRLLNKPCASEMIKKNILTGIEQYNLITAEKVLLERTLLGSIGIMMEMLAIFNPEVFSQTIRLRNLSRKLTTRLKTANIWEIEIGILLSQIGCITIPSDIISKYYHGYVMSEEETNIYYSHPISGHKFISKIPRLEKIAEGIKYQFLNYSSKTIQPNELSQFIKLLSDYDRLIQRGKLPKTAIEILHSRSGAYNDLLLQTLEAEVFNVVEGFVLKSIKVDELQVGMMLADDLCNDKSNVLIRKNSEITEITLELVKNFQRFEQIQESIKVLTKIVQ